MKVFNWFKSWCIGAGVSRQTSALSLRLDKWQWEREHILKQLNGKRNQLIRFEKRLTAITESLLEDLEDAKRIQERYEEELSTVRSENRINQEVTIPLLVSMHKELLARVDAATAMHIQKQVGVVPTDGRFSQ